MKSKKDWLSSLSWLFCPRLVYLHGSNDVDLFLAQGGFDHKQDEETERDSETSVWEKACENKQHCVN